MNSFTSKSKSIAYAVWVIASIFYAYQYILRVMPNIMITDIMSQFGINATTFGQFSGVYYLGYALMHLPVGIILDRFGPRKIVPACILLTVLGMMPLLFSQHWIFPVSGRFFIGMGSSAAILGVFKIIRMTFSEKRFPRMLSISVTIGLLGAIYGGGPVSYMRETIGYQSVIQLLAIGGIILAVITYWLVPNTPNSSQKTVFTDIKEVLSNKQVIWTCLFAGLMVGPLEGFADVWSTIFLKNACGLENTLAASMPSMIFIGMCVGGPILSFIADKINSYLLTVVGTGVIMTVGFFMLLAQPASSTMLSINFFLVGICCAYQILAIYKASTYVKESVVGLTTALANMIIMTFGYAFHSAIGWIINSMGGPEAAKALVYGISVVPIALCIGTVGFIILWLKERAAVQNRLEA